MIQDLEATLAPNDSRSEVVLHFDPSCPFAWIVSRWLLEVEAQIPIDLHFRVMSLSLLNEQPPPDPHLRETSGRLWVFARACAAAQAHGQPALRAFYAALGKRVHDQGVKDVAVLPAALAEAGLPAELADSVWTTEHDGVLRTSHARAVEPLGTAAGAPALHIDGRAVFGPVLTGIPRERQAVAVFHAVRTLAACADWSEMKRQRAAELNFA